MVLIFNSAVSREISVTNFTRVRLSGKLHSASPRAILLPLNLTLVKFIPNFTPTHTITYTYIRTYQKSQLNTNKTELARFARSLITNQTHCTNKVLRNQQHQNHIK